MASPDAANLVNEIFSYLPLSVLLTSGAATASKQLNACVTESIAQRPFLSMSELAAQSRGRLTDEVVHRLLKGIKSGTGDEGSGGNFLHAESLNLNRCPHLTGSSVMDLVFSSSLPKLRRLSLSGSKRAFTAGSFDLHSSPPPLGLQSLDLSSCPQLSESAILSILEVLTGRGSNAANDDISSLGHLLPLPHHDLVKLDIGGCSTTIKDSLLWAVADRLPHLESLSLAGLDKVTAAGVGAVAYRCRKTLRCLNLNGCERVDLILLCLPFLEHLAAAVVEYHQSPEGTALLPPPPGFAGDATAEIAHGSAAHCYEAALQSAADSEAAVLFRTSAALRQSSRQLFQWIIGSGAASSDSLGGGGGGSGGEEEEEEVGGGLFGLLESLDVSSTKHNGTRDGVLAALAWASGGRLRTVAASGSSVSRSDRLLACLSGPRLRAVDWSCCSKLGAGGGGAGAFWLLCPGLRELNLACAGPGFHFRGELLTPGCLPRLRALKVDHNALVDDAFIAGVSRSAPRLLVLSVAGCAGVSTVGLVECSPALADCIELDALGCAERKGDTTTTMAAVSRSFPKLVKFNRRRTAAGAASHAARRLQQSSGASWRGPIPRGGGDSGAGPAPKRLRANHKADPAGHHRSCSLTWTGRSHDQEQPVFQCWTCAATDIGHSICDVCATVCHKGHDVIACGVGKAYCDCAFRGCGGGNGHGDGEEFCRCLDSPSGDGDA